jgi:hypothetical protein
MSEFTECETELKDQAALVDALVEAGIAREHVEVHEAPQHLYGYHGDKRAQTANIIIRRNHVGSSSNDIGFLKKADGTYEAIVSEFDRRSGGNHAQKTGGYNERWLKTLKQPYATRMLEREQAKKGRKVLKTKKGNKVILSVYY